LPVARVDRRGAGRAERDVDAAGLEHGVGEAYVLKGCAILRRLDVEQLQVVDHGAALAVERDRGELVPFSLAVVSHTWFPRMTGDDQARPCSRVFQRTFFVSLQPFGKPLPSRIPVPSGPRNWGPVAARGERGEQQRRKAARDFALRPCPSIGAAFGFRTSLGGISSALVRVARVRGRY
jgi:hypothetical protein